jgi:twitching motility protein PilT
VVESALLNDILRKANESDASDVHLVANHAPMVRSHTIMQPMEMPVLTGEDMWRILAGITNEHQRRHFEQHLDLDFSYEIPGFKRYRVNAHMQRGLVGMAMRAIRTKVPPLAALNLPEVITRLTYLPRGLVLVTGDTGSGKSTTLAAMIQAMNERYKKHIITLEDPVEYTFSSQKCLIEQRELGADMPTFASGLKHALRQDPDIILVGEMRDLETIAIALTAAETGHLVFGTLHTSSAGSTIDRIIDVFPPGQQSQIRTQVAASIQAVVCQTLCKTSDGKGRVAATEVLIATPAVRNLIREGKLQSIPSALQTGSRYGMHTLNQNLAELVTAGSISYETAREKCSDASELLIVRKSQNNRPIEICF